MIGEILAYLAGIVVLAGSTFGLLASVGVLRLPDLYTRLHASSKAGVVGAGLVLVGVALASLQEAVIFRAIAGILFLMLTTPISAHLLSRAAILTGQHPQVPDDADEMRNRQ